MSLILYCTVLYRLPTLLYGIGIRTGIYLSWTNSLLANNLLPEGRKELQKVYLIFSLALCVATMITSLAGSCVFSTEIEVLYWMYWGEYVCVFASSPCSIKLGSKIKWIGIEWTTVLLFLMHMMMVYHGVWYILYAYDQVFARLPCGTYHFFFFAPLIDQSNTFCMGTDLLTNLAIPLIAPLLIVFPLLSVILASELKVLVQKSALYSMMVPRKWSAGHIQSNEAYPDGSSSSISFSHRVLLMIKTCYKMLRLEFMHPENARKGIRLVTPLDIRQRRNYRIRCAAIGISTYLLSVSAIELTLKWNRVSKIYSFATVGQYIPFTIGVASFVSICWRLIQQESERRRDLRRRHKINHQTDDIELEPLSHNITDALSYAFARPDQGFLTNNGALPTVVSTSTEHLSTPLSSAQSSVLSVSLGGEYGMSGAPPDSLESESQTMASADNASATDSIVSLSTH